MSLAISPCGTRALVVSSDARLSLYSTQDPTRPTQTFSERAHLSSAYSSAPSWCPSSGSGSLVALGTASGSVVVWDVSRGEVRARLGGPGSEAPPAPSPEAGAGGGGGGSGSKASKRRSRELGCGGFSGPVTGLCWQGSGEAAAPSLLACAEGSGWVQGWELAADGRAPGAPKATGAPASAAWRTGEKAGLSRVACLVGGGAEDGSSSAEGGSAVVLAAATGCITAVDTAAAAEGKRAAALHSFAGHATPVTAMAVSADQTIFVTASDERTLHLWDLHSLPSGAAPGAAPLPPTCLLLHPGQPLPDGLCILRAGDKGSRKATRKAVYHIACTGVGGTVVLWRYRRGKSGSGEGEGSAEAGAEGGAAAAAATSASASAPPPPPLRPACTISVDRAAWAAANPRSASALNAERPAILACRLVAGAAALLAGGALAAASAEAGGAGVAVLALGPLAQPSFYVSSYTVLEEGGGGRRGRQEGLPAQG